MICKVPAAGGNVFFALWQSCGDIFEPRKTREARKVVFFERFVRAIIISDREN